MVNQLSMLLTRRFPNLLLVTVARKGIQRTILSSTLRALSLLPQKMNMYTMRWPSGITNKFSGPAESIHCRHFRMFCNSSVSIASPMKEDAESHKTVQELLDVFDTSKNSLDTEDLVNLLRKIARAVWHDDNQRQELQKIRAASKQGCSVFRELLNHTADRIGDSNVDDKLVSTILWSLEKIGETNHRLYRKFDRGKIILIKER